MKHWSGILIPLAAMMTLNFRNQYDFDVTKSLIGNKITFVQANKVGIPLGGPNLGGLLLEKFLGGDRLDGGYLLFIGYQYEGIVPFRWL